MRNVAFFGQTDVGKVRTNNEDAFWIGNIWDEDHVLAVVIDGVGGYEGGEVAAAIARDTISEYLQQNSSGDCLELLKQAVIRANNNIFHEREQKAELASMSCVLTASLIELESMRVNIAHVGDTRLYQYSSSHISKLSHDHSLVGYREEIGDLTEEEAMIHPQRNIISRDVGSSLLDESDTTYIEVASYPLDSKTQLLLCSDGLCDMITSKQMSMILSQDCDVPTKVGKLIEAALDKGGRDNVTVVLVDLESDEENLENEETERYVKDEVNEQSCAVRKCSCKVWLFAALFLAGFAAGVLCSPLFFSDKEAVENKSADTTIVEPADTLDSLGRDSLVLSHDADQADTQIHQDVDNENQ